MASSKQNNGGSMVTSESPHFMKIILLETLQNGKLGIPIDFIKKYGKGISSPALLRVPSGEVWKVELTKGDGKVWLKNGWQEFSKHYALERGQFVVFRYQGNSKFHVVILDTTATEIQYPPHTSNHHAQFNEIPEESGNDESIKIIEEIPSAPTRKFKEKLQVPCPRPCKKPRSSDPANITEVINLESESLAPQAMHNGVPAKKVQKRTWSTSYGTQKLKAGEKRLALERAERAFQSENPFFMRVMQPSYVGLTQLCTLGLPADFVREHLMKGDCEITLCNSDGKTWPVKLHQAQSEKGTVYAMLQNGWETFVQDNNLQLGDVCAFELINCNEITLKVVKCQVKDGDSCKSPSWTDDFSTVKRKAGASSAEQECWKALDKLEKAKALGLAKAFKSENPYFRVVMQPYYVHKHRLAVADSNLGATRRSGKRVKIEREESLEIDNESNLPMSEGETLDDFWLAEEIQEDISKSPSRP
ncbi:hypothetical protein COLO4_22195 [Corchorus olitorius]|uniref:TF-B3 domain-containing protein n=1 Tax=Corchorus olitorius TaxID=93759 RepID=A0A1R3INI4_9ROSI|nr:hypothetical protein COLO4_22195 [Corchorus olitorius]